MGDAISERILAPHHAAGPLFLDDGDEALRSIIAIAALAPDGARVAHRSDVTGQSLRQLAAQAATELRRRNG